MRAVMVDAFARFHLADLRLRALCTRWNARKGSFLEPLNRYYDALKMAPTAEHVADSIRSAGEDAEQQCAQNHSRWEALSAERHATLKAALAAMGAYHGAGMAADGNGSFPQRYWRHARRMSVTLRSHIGKSRIVGMEPDFPSTEGWARSLGFTRVNQLFKALADANIEPTWRIA